MGEETEDLRLTAVAGGATIALAVAALVGWALDIVVLRGISDAFTPMMPVTAVVLLALGVATVLVALRHRHAGWVPWLAGAAAAVAVLELVEHALGATTWFDTLLFADEVRALGSDRPGQMALVTAVGLILVAASLVLLWRGRTDVAHLGGVATTTLAGALLIGYLFEVESFHSPVAGTDAALNTVLALFALGVGLVAGAPQHGLLAVRERGPGAALLVHRALPAVVGVSLLVGWLVSQGERKDWYDPAMALAIAVAGAMTLGAVVLWRAALSVAKLEADRGAALDALGRINESLEDEVRTRTADLAASESTQRASLEALGQGVALSDLDGTVLLLNRAGREILGRDQEQLTELFRSGSWETYREDGSILPPAERPLRRTMDTGLATSGTILGWRRADGELRTLEVSTEPVFDDDQLVAVVTAFADVTEARAAQRALRATEARFAALVQRSSDVIIVIQPDSALSYVSPAITGVLGFDETSQLGRSFFDFVHPDDHDEVLEAFRDLREQPGTTAKAELRVIDAEGHWHHAEVVATNRLEDPAVEGIVANVRDITERAEANARVSWLAFHDSLTGLPNRALLLDRLGHALSRAERSEHLTALLFIDLDLFKPVNDTYGHEAGDQLLREVAGRLLHAVRVGDTVARLGGDEFVVLAEELDDPSEAEAVAGRIIEALARPVDLEVGVVSVSASVGIAFDEDHQPATLLRRADTALYLAKARGRNRYEVHHHETPDPGALRRLPPPAGLARP